VGSANLDHRSRDLNTEVILIVESPELAGELASHFELVTQPAYSFRVELEKTFPASVGPAVGDGGVIWIGEEDGKAVIYRDEPFAGFWKNFFAKILSPFAPESIL